MTTPSTTSEETKPETAKPELQRIPVETMGYYYVQPPREPKDGPAPALIACHGWAQAPLEFGEETAPLLPPDFAQVIPMGFNQQWGRRTRKITFSWLSSFEKWDAIERNSRYLADLIDRLASQGVLDPRRVFVLGFSQGSSVAYRFAQRHPELTAGVISVCSDLPADVAEDLSPMKKVPVLVAWGEKDPFTSMAKPDEVAKTLKAAGLDVETHAFDAGHRIPPEFGPVAQAWLRAKRKPAED